MRKTEKRIEGKPLIIATDGKITMVLYKGKVYGDHIEEIQFLHDAPSCPVVEIVADSYPIYPMEMEEEMFREHLEHIIKGKAGTSSEAEGW